MYLICDDVNESEFCKLEKLKRAIPGFKVNCFVMGKDSGDYLEVDWVEVGVHGWEHTYPPECERDDQKYFIVKGLESLKTYLPRRFGFRAPGFQLVASSYPILRDLGFSFIAHRNRIQVLNKEEFKQDTIINCHIYDNLDKLEALDGTLKFLSEGLS
jgi:peptidoglycan/xylan/chitin deacetylase (PgdA/CDA1 family)